MAVERWGAGGADVQVMGWGAGRGDEGFAAGNPEVAFVVVAEGPEPLDDGGQVGAVGDHHVQVDDRLGGEAGDGGAADMLNRNGEWAEPGGQPVAELLEGGGPGWVVADDDDRVGQDDLR